MRFALAATATLIIGMNAGAMLTRHDPWGIAEAALATVGLLFLFRLYYEAKRG